MFLIFSPEKRSWYGPDHCGYTKELAEAGRYTEEEVGYVCRVNCVPWDYVIPVPEGCGPGWVDWWTKNS